MNTSSVVRISTLQVFILIVLFEIGSTIVVNIGSEAKQDAWLAILIASFAGIAILRMYLFILSAYPGCHLFQVIERAIGRWMAYPVAFAFALYFLYISSRVLRDFLELLITDIFPNTPIEVLAVTFMLAISYVLYLGLEVFARTSEIFWPYVLLFLVLISIFLISSGKFKLVNLQPIMAEGFAPISQAMLPGLLTFPYGELIIFTVILAHHGNLKQVQLPAMGAVLLAGGILAYHTLMKVAALGVDYMSRSAFPLLNVVREVSVADVIERLDPFVVFIMMLGIFIKVGLFSYGALQGLEYITHLPYRSLVFPMMMGVALFSILIASNYTEHIEEGIRFVPLYLHLPFQLGVPLLLLIVIVLKKKVKGGSPQHEAPMDESQQSQTQK